MAGVDASEVLEAAEGIFDEGDRGMDRSTGLLHYLMFLSNSAISTASSRAAMSRNDSPIVVSGMLGSQVTQAFIR